MCIWIHTVHMITVKGKRCTGFHCRFQNQTYQILQHHCSLGNTRVLHTVKVALFPFLTIEILQVIALDFMNFMRTHQIPGRIQILFCHLPEQVRITDSRKHIMCLHAVIPVIGSQIQKLRKILVPGI